MSATYDLSDVDLPDEWNAWPEDARRAYLAATLDRGELLALVACRASVDRDALGEDRVRKGGLARLAVALDGGESA